MFHIHKVYTVGLIILLFFLVGCSVPAKTVTEPVEVPDRFSLSGGERRAERWWTMLGDEGLNRSVDSALTNNYELKAAWERLLAARAIADQEGALLWPSLEASASAQTVRSPDDTRSGETVTLGLSAAYEVDLWGRIRSAVEAEQLRTEATAVEYQATALLLSAEIARAWVELAEAQDQVNVVEEQVETNTTVLQLIENRFGLGQVRAVDILRQRQLVERTREQRVVAEERRLLLEHRLSVLMGMTPQAALPQRPQGLPALPLLPDPGIPIDLIQRRPDVRTAFLQLQAADQDVASAISNQFPRLSLSASASTASSNTEQIFKDWLTTLAGNVLAPLFLGGERRAEVDRTKAVRQERLYNYSQAVLLALQDVENALVQEARQSERIGLIEDQLQLADQTFEQLRVQYLNGTNNYLDVLTALDDVQALRRALLSARLTLVNHRIALYLALAGPIEGHIDIAS